MRTVLVLAALFAVSCGESSTPADVSGSYTVSVTNRENGCGFANWTEGAVTQAIPFTISQDGSAVTGVVGGLWSIWYGLSIGSVTFNGTVSGNAIQMTLNGTTVGRANNCTYTVIATVAATSTKDLLEGDVDYTTSTNGSPDCGALVGCHSRQAFNGTRPPR